MLFRKYDKDHDGRIKFGEFAEELSQKEERKSPKKKLFS